MIRKILQPFYTAYVAITFLVSLFLAIPFVLLFSLPGNDKGRYAIWFIVHYWSRIWFFIIGMQVKRVGNFPATGQYVIVANHISYLDTLLIFAAFPRYFRPLGKKEASAIPVFGFVYKQLAILVDRSSIHSRAKSMKLLWRVLHHHGSILIFPEGTFNETGAALKGFYDGAFRLAINTQKPVLPVLFPDTVNRWHYSGWYKLWPGRNRVIYLSPVQVHGLAPDATPALKQQVSSIMETELKKLNYPTGQAQQ